MLTQDQILNFLKVTGPTLPAKVAKNIKTDLLIASAHLADLVSQGKVKISSLKIGGSPLYYLLGQEEQLYPFAAGNINPKDLEVLERLKFNKVLREAELELLPKVALRNLKDFAIPLQVRFRDTTELFWKWHLTSDEETNQLIGSMLNSHQEETPAPDPIATLPQKTPAELNMVAELDTQKEQKNTASENQPEEISQETPDTITAQIPPEKQEITSKKKTEEAKPEKSSKKFDKTEQPTEETTKHKEKQKKLESSEEKKPRGRRKKEAAPDQFLPVITEFFEKLQINIEESEAIRKDKEIDLLIHVPSVVGTMKYYCKAKQKTKCDEKDLSAAYMEAQIKKLPLLFLYTKDLSKKAQEMLESGAFENVVVKKIE